MRSRRLHPIGATALCASLVAASAAAQDTNAVATRRTALLGIVHDAQSGAPVPGVRIVVAGVTTEFATDDGGEFRFVLGGHAWLALSFQRMGYRPLTRLVEAKGGDTTRVAFEMFRVARLLDTVNVKDFARDRAMRYAGFERRRAQGLGTFLTRDFIERRNAPQTMNLLQGLPGVRIVDSGDVHLIVSSRGQRADLRNSQLADCPMAIGVDGHLRGHLFDVNAVDPKEIHAIEVYRGPASMPRDLMSMGADGSCGLVMIWTRSK
jgi:hypothetical protein